MLRGLVAVMSQTVLVRASMQGLLECVEYEFGFDRTPYPPVHNAASETGSGPEMVLSVSKCRSR